MKLKRKSAICSTASVLLGIFVLIPTLATPSLASLTRKRAEAWIARIDSFVQPAGFRRVKFDFGSLAEGETKSYSSIRLTANKAQGFLAECDEDCNGLELSLVDRKGNVVAVGLSQIPPIVPTRTETYTLEVSMDGCSSEEPCDFVWGHYRR